MPLFLKTSLCTFLPSLSLFPSLVRHLCLPPEPLFLRVFLPFLFVCFPLDLNPLAMSVFLHVGLSACVYLCAPLSVSASVLSLWLCSSLLPFSLMSLCVSPCMPLFVLPPPHPRTHWLPGVGVGGRQAHPDPLSGDEDPQGDLRDKQEQQYPKILRGKVERSG